MKPITFKNMERLLDSFICIFSFFGQRLLFLFFRCSLVASVLAWLLRPRELRVWWCPRFSSSAKGARRCAVLARSGLVLAAAVASALSLALFSLCAGFLSLVRWLRRPKVVPFVRIFGLALILS